MNAYEMCRTMIPQAAALGYGEYRAQLSFMDLVTDQYVWGHHAQRRFNERIKDALDPDGILMPGRAGIWPANMRNQEHQLPVRPRDKRQDPKTERNI